MGLPTNLESPLADPDFRRHRAQTAAAARTSVDYFVKKIVDAAPKLTAEQRDCLAVILRAGGDAA